MSKSSPSALRRIARAATGGPRGYFNDHFGMLKQDVIGRLDTLGHEVAGVRRAAEQRDASMTVSLEKYEETVALLGAHLARLSNQLDDLGRSSAQQSDVLRAVQREVEVVRGRPVPDSFAELDRRQIELLNFNATHRGYAAQAGLWLNPALHVSYGAGGAELGGVNERVAEIPFVFRALAGLPAGARVLDIGACESTVAFSLASLGYRVTALDPRPYPLSHPNLTAVTAAIESYEDAEGFDGAILLSTVEHIGVGAYSVEGDDDADLAAMANVRRLLKPGGRVVVTTPFGVAGIDELERTYDPDGVHRLLAGYELELVEVARRTSPTTWEHEPAGLDTALDDSTRVVMLTARVATDGA